jgi:hypothetical protein
MKAAALLSVIFMVAMVQLLQLRQKTLRRAQDSSGFGSHAQPLVNVCQV